MSFSSLNHYSHVTFQLKYNCSHFIWDSLNGDQSPYSQVTHRSILQLYVGAEAADKSGHGVGRTQCAHVEFWECGWVITAALRTHLMGKWTLRVANVWQRHGVTQASSPEARKGSMRAGLLRKTCFSPLWITFVNHLRLPHQRILEFIYKTTTTLRTNVLLLTLLYYQL